ncbi:CHL4-domain-containing protein [Eremomyces bilateralis CBS 781.70]|uniref:CHL4-domain-containing protein n=1 Tax=Eremomyces bilateralis CBS 781.70 TaxID=1392243 RepID=A0A6G1FZH6_9PEZI|nr:CHL4-domain-containing protein [Eremomyces bilateralis CBS 781.70]KAF1811122.1 CHL4-domain-containing protein [Eremomyces bilateralis CBS 781.70]
MAPRLSIPTHGGLKNTHRIPSSSPLIHRTLSRLSRASLISLALSWLSDPHIQYCVPYTLATLPDPSTADDDPDAPFDTAESIEEAVEIYEEFQEKRSGTKRDVLERILEGDWRHGITLYQLGMAETRWILDQNGAVRWTALRLSRHENSKSESAAINKSGKTGMDKRKTCFDAREERKNLETLSRLPRFHAPTFLLNLQREIGSLMRTHYYLARHPEQELTILRVYIHDSPYNTQRSLHDPRTSNVTTTSTTLDASKSVFFIFPDNTPYLYASLGATSKPSPSSDPPSRTRQPADDADAKSLKKVLLAAIPKALSRPHFRLTLKSTSLSARSLNTLLAMRGAGRTNHAQGAWSIFAHGSVGHGALAFETSSNKRKAEEVGGLVRGDEDKENIAPEQGKKRLRSMQMLRGSENDPKRLKRLEGVSEGRFGESGKERDGVALERVEVRMDEVFSRRGTAEVGLGEDADLSAEKDGEEGETWRPQVRISFNGSHVFAGIRKLVEMGVVNGERMPGWMTGEAGVSVGCVRDGRIVRREVLGKSLKG